MPRGNYNTPYKPQPTIALGLCPACNGPMQWKQNRTTGNWFMGCHDFPTCTGTRDSQGNDSRISPQRQNRQWAMLVASVLRSEDEVLSFSYDDLVNADKYELHLDDVPEERSYILTVKKK